MIKLSQAIPEVWDLKDEKQLRDWMIAVKACIEEIERKAQSRQMEIRSTIPTTNDLEEQEFIAYLSGTTYRIYTKQNGIIKYWSLT